MSQKTNSPIALKRGMRRVEDPRIAGPEVEWQRILRQDESLLVVLLNDCWCAVMDVGASSLCLGAGLLQLVLESASPVSRRHFDLSSNSTYLAFNLSLRNPDRSFPLALSGNRTLSLKPIRSPARDGMPKRIRCTLLRRKRYTIPRLTARDRIVCCAPRQRSRSGLGTHNGRRNRCFG